MEDLISQFTLLSNQALHDKNFDPSSIQDLMKLFEIEAYRSWACLEQDFNDEVESAQESMDSAEQELNLAMENAMAEFARFEQEMEREGMDEYHSLIHVAEGARMMGMALTKAATAVSNKYIQSALASATNSMKSAWKLISKPKVHPC